MYVNVMGIRWTGHAYTRHTHTQAQCILPIILFDGNYLWFCQRQRHSSRSSAQLSVCLTSINSGNACVVYAHIFRPKQFSLNNTQRRHNSSITPDTPAHIGVYFVVSPAANGIQFNRVNNKFISGMAFSTKGSFIIIWGIRQKKWIDQFVSAWYSYSIILKRWQASEHFYSFFFRSWVHRFRLLLQYKNTLNSISSNVICKLQIAISR